MSRFITNWLSNSFSVSKINENLCLNLALSTTLLEFAALLAICRVVVACEAGVQHLAAGQGDILFTFEDIFQVIDKSNLIIRVCCGFEDGRLLGKQVL